MARDGSNPLARVDVIMMNDGLEAVCDCGTRLVLDDDGTTCRQEVNLQDLVIGAHEHAGSCRLHLENLSTD